MNEFTRKALESADGMVMHHDTSDLETYRSALLAHLEGGEQNPCEWKLDDYLDYEIWHSACGEAWSFNDGGPAENRIRFCQGCGKPVKILPAIPTEAPHE